MSKYGVFSRPYFLVFRLNTEIYVAFSGPYFPVFGLNTEIYDVNLRIQSEYRKIRNRKNSVFGHSSRRVMLLFCLKIVLISNYYLRNNQIRIHYDQSKLYRTISKPKTSTLIYQLLDHETKRTYGFSSQAHKHLPWGFT